MRYRAVDVKIWGDLKFRLLSPLLPSGQALFLYLLTNPNTTSIPGLYRIGPAAMAEELGWANKDLLEAFQEVIKQGLVKADFQARVIFIPNAIKYNKPQSPNVIIGWDYHWDEIPECELKDIAHQSLKAFIEGMGKAFREAFEKAISKSYLKTMPNQEQEQKQEQEQTEHLCEVMTSPLNISDPTPSNIAKEVFGYWQHSMNHPRSKLDDKRQTKIMRALKLGYTKEDLKQAVDGCAKTPFNMGENDRSQRYDDIALILRDAEHIDRFINNAINPPSSLAHKSTPVDLMTGVI